ncbi:hypothetical protein [Embleya hyalina]|uniref:Uncharacterized protein n=1 Tax=Embleya hyalina TaxID=516124 RepID=A0A401Z009_9ACTN|nr:hypothetical protein [Embleya hyalina]GCE00152.1 hypothetical protein EHYA_07877 [Embleya hyalina]
MKRPTAHADLDDHVNTHDAVTHDLAALLPTPAERDLPAGRAEGMAATLFQALHDAAAEGAARAPVSPRRRWAWRIGVPLAVLAAGGGTMAAMLIDDTPVRVSYPQQTACSYTYTVEPAFLYTVHVDAAQTPEEACAAVWDAMTDTARTYLPTDSPERAAPRPAVPQLVACTRKGDDNGLWTMPKPTGVGVRDACAALGMTRPDDGARYRGATIDRVRRLNRLLSGPAAGGRCPNLADVRARVERALAEVGITTWSIRTELEPGADPNVVFPVVDPERAAVVLRNGPPGTCAEPAGR